jgi:hypothetical protein
MQHECCTLCNMIMNKVFDNQLVIYLYSLYLLTQIYTASQTPTFRFRMFGFPFSDSRGLLVASNGGNHCF